MLKSFNELLSLAEELTQKVQDIVPWVKDWHIVVSALENLGVILRKYQTSKGVQYQIHLEKVSLKAEEKQLTSGKARPEGLQGSSIPEVYKTLKELLKEPFYYHRAVEVIRQLRQCSYEEAEKLFQLLVEEGKVFRNSYGLWEWAR